MNKNFWQEHDIWLYLLLKVLVNRKKNRQSSCFDAGKILHRSKSLSVPIHQDSGKPQHSTFFSLFPIYTKLAVLLLHSTVLIFFLKLFCWEFLMYHRKSLWTRELGQKCSKIFLFHLDHMLLWKIRLIRTELALLTLKDVSSSTIQKETTRANYSQRKWGPRRAKIGFQSGSSCLTFLTSCPEPTFLSFLKLLSQNGNPWVSWFAQY